MSLGNKEIMAKNIRRYLDIKGLNPRQMAIELDFKYTTVLDWVNAKTYPRIDKIEIMANFFGIQKSDLVEDKPQTEPKAIDQLTAENKKKALAYINTLLKEQHATIEEPQQTYQIKAVSALAAGHGFPYDDYDISTVTVANKPPRHDIASRVRGDSMLPVYEDGDVVYLVDKGFSRYDGEVCAVVVDDQTYIKKVYLEPGGLRLVSINPAYPDKFIDFPPSGDTHIKIYSVVGSDEIVKKA